ncbi:MAG TPA: tetratricopeptide repeat protein [Bacteroidia bacterium]|nr:tetratricopeptide repeat protein [Bacteroidia bacterium]
MAYTRPAYFPLIVLILLWSRQIRAQQDSLELSKDSLAPDTIVTQQDSLLTAQQEAEAESELAPDSNSFQFIDRHSYELYLTASWKELAAYCEKAFKDGHDSYYLRMRAGMAYYALKRYRSATPHFRKALELNSADDTATWYLYSGLLYSERFEEAKRLSLRFGSGLQETTGSRNYSPIDYIVSESGFKHSDSSALFRNPLFASLGLQHDIGRKVFLFHNLNYFGQNEYRFNVEQFQYYLRATFPLRNNLSLSAAMHIVHVNADLKELVTGVLTSTSVISTGTGQPIFPPQQQTVTIYTPYEYETINNKQSYNSIAAIELRHHGVILDVQAGTTFAHFDTTAQFQLNAGLAIYPLQNNRLKLGINLYLHKESVTPVYNMAFAPYLNVYLGSKIHLSLNYYSNTGPNISEYVASFISNSVDYTLQRTTVTLSCALSRNLWLYGTTGLEQKKQIYESFVYNYRIFALGVKMIPGFK